MEGIIPYIPSFQEILFFFPIKRGSHGKGESMCSPPPPPLPFQKKGDPFRDLRESKYFCFQKKKKIFHFGGFILREERGVPPPGGEKKKKKGGFGDV